jgi:hypothetical protein
MSYNHLTHSGPVTRQLGFLLLGLGSWASAGLLTLDKSFAAKAVRRLSSSIHPDDQVAGMMSARVALTGLIFMACESARMDPPRDSITGGWSNDTVVFTEQLMDDYVRKHGVMTRRLQAWKEIH